MVPRSRRNDPGQGTGPSRYPGTFQLAFREAVNLVGWQIRSWKGDRVDCTNTEGKDYTIGVDNLYRRVRLEDRSEWPGLIVDFFQGIKSAELTDGMPAHLADVTDQLLLRLGRPFTEMPDGSALWHRYLKCGELGLNLVIDYPESMSYVTEQLLVDSGKPPEHWLEIAVSNLKQCTPRDCLRIVHPEADIRLCNVADAYDSSRALILDHILPETAGEGCFVVMPGRDELLVLPVSTDAFQQVHMLKLLAEKNFRTAPYPISDHLFWVHRGEVCVFGINIGDDEVHLDPPGDFLHIYRRLVDGEFSAEQS